MRGQLASTSQIPAPGQQVSLHLVGEEGLLYDRQRQAIYSANTLATVIWCCMLEQMTSQEIMALLQERFALPQATAACYLRDLLAQWRELNLLDGHDAGRAPAARANDEPPAHAPLAGTLTAPVSEIAFRLLDTGFRLRFGSIELAERAAPLLAHLATGAPVGAAECRVDLFADGAGYVLAEGRRVVERCDSLRQVVPMMKAGLAYLTLERSRDFCAVHAASAAVGGRALLMPAESGSGKSTLSAALMHGGFTYLGDDTAILSQDGLAARPLPFSLCLKDGAWPVLSKLYPGLEHLPVERRLDEKIARYLPPPQGAWCNPGDARFPIGWVVFPKYESGAPTQLSPVGKAAAIKRLLPACYSLAGALDAAMLDRLVAWIEATPCYELRLSDLGDAVRTLKELCQ